MRKLINLLVVVILFTIASCATNPHVGNSYYTQFALQYEKNSHYTTNYRKGILLPINSEVKIKKMNKKSIVAEVVSLGQEIRIINVPKHTGQNIDEAFDRIFAQTPKGLSGFSDLEKRNIKLGKVEKGMRKEAVIAAIGYPPQIETASLEANEWTYWSARFNKFKVFFQDNKVTNVKN